MSARDSQGGASPPGPGVPGLSRFTPPPQHRPSPVSVLRPPRVSPAGIPQMQPLPAAASPAPNSCSGPPCRVPALCLSRSPGPAPASRSQNILRDLGLGG